MARPRSYHPSRPVQPLQTPTPNLPRVVRPIFVLDTVQQYAQEPTPHDPWVISSDEDDDDQTVEDPVSPITPPSQLMERLLTASPEPVAPAQTVAFPSLSVGAHCDINVSMFVLESPHEHSISAINARILDSFILADAHAQITLYSRVVFAEPSTYGLTIFLQAGTEHYANQILAFLTACSCLVYAYEPTPANTLIALLRIE